MTIDVNSKNKSYTCTRCGTVYTRRGGVFQPCHTPAYKGTGYIPVCKECIYKMYEEYYAKSGNMKSAIRQVCRKLDLYWNEEVFESATRKTTPTPAIFNYITKLNSTKYIDLCYDDTLMAEGTMWSFSLSDGSPISDKGSVKPFKVTDEMLTFWGTGYTNNMYEELEQRRAYYMSKLPDGAELDVGSEALIRQICNLEVNIAKDSAAGKPIDKSVNSLNTLLGSLNMKPAQKKESSDGVNENTPFGVWIKRWEDELPIPEVDPELEDLDGIKKHITVWFYGHLCKMLGIKNGYCRLYEEELEKLRVEHPEYDEDDDDGLIFDLFGGDDESDD